MPECAQSLIQLLWQTRISSPLCLGFNLRPTARPTGHACLPKQSRTHPMGSANTAALQSIHFVYIQESLLAIAPNTTLLGHLETWKDLHSLMYNQAFRTECPPELSVPSKIPGALVISTYLATKHILWEHICAQAEVLITRRNKCASRFY